MPIRWLPDAQDVAAFVRPLASALDDLNSPLANWIVEDPCHAPPPALPSGKPHPRVRPAPVSVAEGDVLLAVIHGHGAAGWRDPAARQAYLLKDAAGVGLAAQGPAELGGGLQRRLRLSGDVLRQTLEGRSGFLYWTGARYAWHELTSQASR